VSPVKYELGFYIPEDDILHSHCRESLRSYTAASVVTEISRRRKQRGRNKRKYWVGEWIGRKEILSASNAFMKGLSVEVSIRYCRRLQVD
jgi:hypothetical protein